MLATLLRHTRRPEEAARQLDMLVRLDEARNWELEIQHRAGPVGGSPRSS